MRAHRCLAWSHSMMKQFDQAIMHIEVAHELNPNNSWNAISAATLLAFCGKPERASELAALAMDMTLAPSLTHWIYHATIDYLRGDYEAAIRGADLSQNVGLACSSAARCCSGDAWPVRRGARRGGPVHRADPS